MSETDTTEEQKGENKESARRQGTLTKQNGGKREGCDDKAQMGRRVPRQGIIKTNTNKQKSPPKNPTKKQNKKRKETKQN